MKLRIISIVLGLLTALPLFANTPGEVEVGHNLREAQMQGLLGPSSKLSAYRGRPLLINVWASWCGPCREEMGSLERLSQQFRPEQLRVIGISTDDYRDRAEKYLSLSGVTFPNYLDSQLMLENMLGANRLPLTVLVDAQGHVVAKFFGAKQWDSPQSLAMVRRQLRIKP